MSTLSYRTAGESHGKALLTLVEGLPAGVPLDSAFIDNELRRRQGGYGRGGRQKIETDRAEFLTGVRLGKSIGAPIMMLIPNKDSRLDDLKATPPLHRPRPGHADLAGSIKWLTTDCRETLERASARETAARVAAGGLARCFLRAFGIEVFGFVRTVGEATAKVDVTEDNWRDLVAKRDASEVYCPDPEADAAMREFINQQKMAKDTAGGVVETHVFGCPVGIGSCMTWDGRLDGRIAAAVMGIQAFKGVEIGLGFETARRPGSQVHDEIFYDKTKRDTPGLGFARGSNNAGGLEGGMTNGMPVVVRGAMKPISTLGKPLRSIDLNTREPSEAGWERSDISAISAASCVMENVIAFEIARAMLEKFGGDSLAETKQNYDMFLRAARELPVSRDA
ncbi:chorismate synthase [Humisphaera borealis]|uniref:Chorismate synthase n=1 Tax=Humisphaera borealis TaxID=2807512 RepID=A0A7M2WXJ6_9BACT|nr:chorismate synthase [Humisphaera borealis]QOV90074.1 chorismate synthase [Humisphaera borealis]